MMRWGQNLGQNTGYLYHLQLRLVRRESLDRKQNLHLYPHGYRQIDRARDSLSSAKDFGRVFAAVDGKDAEGGGFTRPA